MLRPDHHLLIDALRPGPATFAQIQRATMLPTDRVALALVELEAAHVVRYEPRALPGSDERRRLRGWALEAAR